MKTTAVTLDDLSGVFAVPPLARRAGAGRPLDLAENDKIVRHMSQGGLSRFLYGGNAFLYHGSPSTSSSLDWMSGIVGWAIPSLGPSFGRAMDQAPLLRRYSFPCAMALPCGDPRDAQGLEAGLREISSAAGMSLVLYLKSEDGFGSDLKAGLDAVARLVDDGTCVSIKYAVVRKDPAVDPYLTALLERVDRRRVVSGIGERPAVAHMSGFRLSGSPRARAASRPRSRASYSRPVRAAAWGDAEAIRARFLPLEDQRDAWGPARVLHAALELAGGSPGRDRSRRSSRHSPTRSARLSSPSPASCCGSIPSGARPRGSPATSTLSLPTSRGSCARRRPRCTRCRRAALRPSTAARPSGRTGSRRPRASP